MSTYFHIWDDLKDKGVLFEYVTPKWGVMIDNEKVLELTRAQLKLKNPNEMN